MNDMDPAWVVGNAESARLHYFDGSERTVLFKEEEVPYPEGELIVSRTDRAGFITHVNPAFCHLSGYSPEELLGQPHSILRHPDMPRAAFADLWATVGAGNRWHGYVKNLCKDGRFYWVYATVIPNVRQGDVVGYTSVRRKPSRLKVEEAEKLYCALRQAES